MMTATSQSDISESVLDQAFQWTVVLNSGTHSKADQQGFNHWLGRDTTHEKAWQRIQLIEQEFSAAKPAANNGVETLKQVAKQRQQHKTIQASLFSVFLLCALVFLLSSPLLNTWQAEYVAATGEQQHIQLAGGTQLHLNSNTALDIDETGAQPLVRLYRGQVFVDSSAAAPTNKPTIITEQGRFTPIGTRFSVHQQEQATELLVTQGRVVILINAGQANDGQLNASYNTQQAIAGERWRMTNDNVEKLTATGINPESWLDGVIEADNARLGDVLDALNQHRKGWLRYDSDVAELHVTGVFRLDDSNSALNALEVSMPLNITRITPWWVSVAVQ